MDQLVSDSQFTSVPQPLVDEEVQNYNEYMEAICVSFYGCDLETFVTTYYQMTMDEYNAQLTEMAQETVKQYLVIEAVARQEGIEITDEDINKKAEDCLLYTSDLDVDEYVTLGEYKDMTVQAAKTEVTDEVIENYINGNMLTTYPVSYTHLDVYKRQDFRGLMKKSVQEISCLSSSDIMMRRVRTLLDIQSLFPHLWRIWRFLSTWQGSMVLTLY